MPITQPVKIEAASAKDFAPLPKDVYPFELIDIELTTEKGYQTEELEDKLKFEFACLEEAYYGRRMWQRCTLKLTGGKKPSNLFNLLSGVLNRTITAEELKDPSSVFTDTFLNGLIGKQLRLSLGLKPNEKDPTIIKNTIESYLPAKGEFPKFDKEKSKALAEAAKKQQEGAAPTADEAVAAM